MTEGQILFFHGDGLCLFKLIGELRHTACVGLDKLARELQQGALLDCQHVVIDLAQAEFLDSTNIGLLATIARATMSRLGCRPTLYSPRAEITGLLRDMCLERAFVMVDEVLDSEIALVDVTDVDADEATRARMILQAHRALIEQDERNREAFQSLVDLLQKQLNTG